MRCGLVGCILIRIAVLVSATDDEMVQAVTSEKVQIPYYEPGTDLLNAPELYLKMEGKTGKNLSAKYQGPKFISEFAMDGKPLGDKNDPTRCKLLDWKRRRKREDFIISKLNQFFSKLKNESKIKDNLSQKINFSDLLSLLKNNTGVKGGVETDSSLSLINSEEPQCHTFRKEREANESTPCLSINTNSTTNQDSPIEKQSDVEIKEANTTVKEEISIDVSKISETESPIIGGKMANNLIQSDNNNITNKDENSLLDFSESKKNVNELSEIHFQNESSALVSTTSYYEEDNLLLFNDVNLRDKRFSNYKKSCQKIQNNMTLAQNFSSQHSKMKRFHEPPEQQLPLPLTLQEDEGEVRTVIKKIKNDKWGSKTTDDETSSEISNLTDTVTESLDLFSVNLDTNEFIQDLSSVEPESFNKSNLYTTKPISLLTYPKEMVDQIDEDFAITHQPKAKIIISGSIISNSDLVKPEVLSARPVSLVDSFAAAIVTPHASTKKLIETELMQRSSDCHPKGTGPLTPTDYDPEAYGPKSEEEVEDALTGKLADRVVEVVMAKACKCPRMLKELGLYAQSNLTLLKYSLTHPESKASCQSQSMDALKATVLHDICEAVDRLANTKSQGMCLKPPEDLAEFLSFLLSEDPDMDLPEPAPVIMPRREVDYLFKTKTNFKDDPAKEYYNSYNWLDSLKCFEELPDKENYFNPHVVPLVNAKDNFFESMEHILNSKDQQWNDAMDHIHDSMDKSHLSIDHYHDSKDNFHDSKDHFHDSKEQFLISKDPSSETKSIKKVFKPHNSRKKDKKLGDAVIRKRYTPWSLNDYP